MRRGKTVEGASARGPMSIQYPWHRPPSSPTPAVLWVCMDCGVAFWAPELADRRYACRRGDCTSNGAQNRIRRATAAESEEAVKHLAVDHAAARRAS